VGGAPYPQILAPRDTLAVVVELGSETLEVLQVLLGLGLRLGQRVLGLDGFLVGWDSPLRGQSRRALSLVRHDEVFASSSMTS
jgi:hypothetical protein